MLEPIKPPATPEERLDRIITGDDRFALCSVTGAELSVSRAQYTLVLSLPNEFITRHYSRRKVGSLEEAIEKANKSLKKICQERGIRFEQEQQEGEAQ